MKASELRIGNYLMELGEVFQVWEIGLFDEDIIINDSSYNHRVEPIPLTEEWLVRFGFYEVEESEVYDKDIDGERYISINIKPKKCFVGASVDWISIKFPKSVHQLQNLYFALTGEELTIKL